MENGAYYARVADDHVVTVFADEDVVRDAQMRRIFAGRDKALADQKKEASRNQRKAHRQMLKQARKFRTMLKECAWLTGSAALVYCTYQWGVYAAIAAIVGCMVAVGCRIIHYITMKRR